MKLVSTDTVFADVKQMLKTYNAAGLINDSDLFRWTVQIINRLGISQLVEKEIVLDIENYKVQLPEDFNMLWVAHKCKPCCGEEAYTSKIYRLGGEQRLHLKDWVNIHCYDQCDTCRNDEEYFVTRVVELEDKQLVQDKFCDRTLLSFNKRVSKDKCHTKCPNLYTDCKDQFNLDDKYMYFNFCEGCVHIQYYANPFDEEGYPLILDNTYMSQAVEDYLIYKTLQMIYLNNNLDVERRMMDMRNEHYKSMNELLKYDKLPTFKKIIEFSKEYPKSLEVFNLDSLANGRYKTNKCS
jgi:hypothetical protein